MNVRQAAENAEYTVLNISVADEELRAFLFSLGCYEGEKITVVRHLKGGSILLIKNGRYHVDTPLAEAITIEE